LAHARTRHHSNVEVTLEYISELFDKQGGKCALTGWDIVFGGGAKDWRETTASLDRIDSRLGYIEGNVQWVHKDVNIAKHDYPQNYFIELCRAVADELRE
jgi:hypothetical protein